MTIDKTMVTLQPSQCCCYYHYASDVATDMRFSQYSNKLLLLISFAIHNGRCYTSFNQFQIKAMFINL